MDEEQWEKKPREEGFGDFFVWQDGPNACYPEHTHGALTAHVILEGEMTLTLEGDSRLYATGDRVDVPARAVHSARMGPKGCKYLVGQK
jgi:quercetin dioxygenase-like cupin family protein